jgi:hypothetical protein
VHAEVLPGRQQQIWKRKGGWAETRPREAHRQRETNGPNVVGQELTQGTGMDKERG